jgi:hypothetical protein
LTAVSFYIPVVMIADRIAAALQSGWAALRRTVVAETCGHDMDVPDMMLYFTTRWSPSSFVEDDASLHAAMMFSPGAVTSGCDENISLIIHSQMMTGLGNVVMFGW